MLLTGKAEDGTRILGRKTLELMHTTTSRRRCCRTPSPASRRPATGSAWARASRWTSARPRWPAPLGEFGWAGAAKTYFWVDPVEELVGVLLTQHMVGFDLPEADFRAVVYQAIED